MTAYSVSSSKGKGNLRHNHRENTKRIPHVDDSKRDENVELMRDVWLKELPKETLEKIEKSKKNQDFKMAEAYLKKIYNDQLGPSIARTNPLKSKKDRFAGDGWEYAHKDQALRHYFDEVIHQLGNRDTELLDRKVQIEYFKRSLAAFIEANPNLHVFSATIHFDEPNGTPHMHIAYVPIYDKTRECYELDNDGNIQYERTPKGKLTNRPQKKILRDRDGNPLLNKNGKPKTVKLRGLDIYINGDKAILEQGKAKLTGKELDSWLAMGTEARFKKWHQEDMERMHQIAKEMGLETKVMGNTKKHLHHEAFKEKMRLEDLQRVEVLKAKQASELKVLVKSDQTSRILEEALEKEPEKNLLTEIQQKETQEAIDYLEETIFKKKPPRIANGENKGKVAIILAEDQFKEAEAKFALLKTLFDLIKHPIKWLLKRIKETRFRTAERKQEVKDKYKPLLDDAEAKEKRLIEELKQKYARMQPKALNNTIARLQFQIESDKKPEAIKLLQKELEIAKAEKKQRKSQPSKPKAPAKSKGKRKEDISITK